MRAVIHQPYFLPWMGFFSKLALVDTFIALDDVAFRKRHYQDRTRILNMRGEVSWLSLPTGENLGARLMDVELKSFDHANRMESYILHSYRRARAFDQCWEMVKGSLGPIHHEKNLADVNLKVIKSLCGLLGMTGLTFQRASATPFSGTDRTERLLHLLQCQEVKTLLIGDGAGIATHDWRAVAAAGVSVEVLNFSRNHPAYQQLRRSRTGFASGLSIVDSMLNVGLERTCSMLRVVNPMPLSEFMRHVLGEERIRPNAL